MTFLSATLIFHSFLSGYDVKFQDLVSTWLIVMIIVIAVCFVVSEITRNYSQVDKLWSLIPIAYGWITVAAFPSARTIIMALLVTAWGLRLSYNFSRKGGYNIIPWKGEEDYRWKYLRENRLLKGRLSFGLFNLLFISIYQNILIFLFSSPLLMAALNNERSLIFTDILAAGFMLLFIITESVADNQLFRFQQEKKKPDNNDNKYKKSLKTGFLSEGLWKYARHPNFASEQAIWISFYFFGVAASGKLINVTLAGAILLVLIFAGSTIMTEGISSKKYPEYAVHQKEVPKFIPKLKS
jgi:steroid 5-alpha reductase family enzyme